MPFQRELGIRAIREGGVRVDNMAGIRSTALVGSTSVRSSGENAHRARAAALRRYRGDRAQIDLHDRCAVIVDDGFATGSSARALPWWQKVPSASRWPPRSRSAVPATSCFCRGPRSFLCCGRAVRRLILDVRRRGRRVAAQRSRGPQQDRRTGPVSSHGDSASGRRDVTLGGWVVRPVSATRSALRSSPM